MWDIIQSASILRFSADLNKTCSSKHISQDLMQVHAGSLVPSECLNPQRQHHTMEKDPWLRMISLSQMNPPSSEQDPGGG